MAADTTLGVLHDRRRTGGADRRHNRRRPQLTVAVLAGLLVAAGCSSGGSSGPGGQAGEQTNPAPVVTAPPTTVVPFRYRTNAILAANCGSGNSSSSEVHLDPTTGQVVDQQTVPSIVLGGDCKRTHSANFRYIPQDLGDQSDGSHHIGYFDADANQSVDVTAKTAPASTGFSGSPTRDDAPRFIGDILIYNRSSDDPNQAFDPATGQAVAVPYGISGPTLESPNGKRIAGTDDDGTDHYLSLDTVPPTSGVSVNGLTGGNVMVTGQPPKPIRCLLIDWVSDNKLLCEEPGYWPTGQPFTTIDLSQLGLTPPNCYPNCLIDFKDSRSWTLPHGPVRLLPPNTRNNFSAIPSADGATVAFLSTQGSETGLYEEPITGGAPKLIAPAQAGLTLLAWP